MTTMAVRSIASLAAVLLLCGVCMGDVHFRAGSLDTARAPLYTPALLGTADLDQHATFVVELVDKPTRALLSAAHECLALEQPVLRSYLPDHAYLAFLSHRQALALQACSHAVRWVGPMPAQFKMEADLWNVDLLDAASEDMNDFLSDVDRGLLLEIAPGADARQTALAVRRALLAQDVELAQAISVDVVSDSMLSLGFAYRGVASQGSGHAPSGHSKTLAAVSKTVQAAAAVDAVVWVELSPHLQWFNKWQNQFLQSAQVAPEGQAPNQPFWDAGITGDTQVIGIGDSGLDTANCFFYDPQNKVQFYNASTLLEPARPTQHRKVVGYFQCCQNSSTHSIGQHGTHCAGSIAGNVLPGSSNFNSNQEFAGVARDAKLAFYEVNFKTIGRQDLSQSYFPYFYKFGARVVSNSWGANTNTYTLMAKQTDRFTAQYQDFLPIYAAGNNGADGVGSVGSPSIAKNVLSIGASMNAYASFHDQDIEGYTVNSFTNYLCGSSMLFQFSYSNSLCYRVVRSKAPCVDQVKELCANMNGATCCRYNSRCCTFSKENIDANPDLFQDNNMAGFSSLGPTADKRIKPDLVAPGQYIRSARAAHRSASDPQSQPDAGFCGTPEDASPATQLMAGTSMATPGVSGAAALLRNYLTAGFFPSGKAVAADRIANPPAALLKALLVQSTFEITGNVMSKDGTVGLDMFGPLPNIIQGHGALDLTRVLPLQGVTQSVKTLLFYANQPLETGDSFTACVQLTGAAAATPFQATLAWQDPAPSMSARQALVNQLQLSVEQPGGQVIYPNGMIEADVENNVQKVVDPTLNAGVYKVRVEGHMVPADAQQYALVVSGVGLQKAQC